MPPKFSIRRLDLRLTKKYPILENISLEIPSGSITAVIGPSGSGKSSLLRCLNRLWEPPPECIFMGGEDITVMDVLSLRRRVGTLFQKAALFDGTVADNITFGPGLHGEEVTDERLAELLKMVDLHPDIAAQPVDQLSGGQAQRVSLARTLANRPEVLLLDEPTSALDPGTTQRIENTILHLRNTLGLTVIWVSHAFAQVERTADQIVLLVDGRVAEAGDTNQVLTGEHHPLIDDFAAGRL